MFRLLWYDDALLHKADHMNTSDIPKPVSIIHRECGEEAFKYVGDTSHGCGIVDEYIIDYHPDHKPIPGGPIMCRSCSCKIDGLWDLYPQLENAI